MHEGRPTSSSRTTDTGLSGARVRASLIAESPSEETEAIDKRAMRPDRDLDRSVQALASLNAANTKEDAYHGSK